MIQFGYFCKDVGDVLKGEIKQQNYQNSTGEHDSKNELKIAYFSPKFYESLNVLSMYNIGCHNANNGNEALFDNIENRE